MYRSLCKNIMIGAGVMAQQLILPCVAHDLSWFLVSRLDSSQLFMSPAPGNLYPLLESMGT